MVEIPEAKEPEDENTLVWYIAATGEYFDKYSAYLARMDFYNQRKFICELTGHSCLTYFEAVESERRESEQVIRSFPDPLKEPILRRVQFSQVSRLDALVDDVYSSLKNEFFPGELAIAKVGEQRVRVIVREKARFNAIMAPDGTVAKPAYSRYRVQMVADDSQDMAVEESQLSRDRKLFTKLILRTFIKHAVSRESWAGAPWVVKPEYAHRYRLDTSWPLHLRRPPAAGGSESPGQGRGKKGDGKSKIKTEDDGTGATHKFKLETGEKRKRGSKKDGEDGAKKRVKGENDAEGGTKKRGRKDAANADGTPSAEPTATSTTGRGKKAKWVENDLDVPREPGEKDAARPPWKRELESDQQHLIGGLLEAWVFMNMYSEPLLLEPFTFDAFLDALRMSEPAGESTLLDEVHCALLAQMVDEDGDLQVTLPIAAKPKRRRGDSDDEDEEEGESDEDDADKDKNGDADMKDVNGKTENGSSKVKDKVSDKDVDEDEDEDEEQDQDNDQDEDQDQQDEDQDETHDQNQESGSESESDDHQAEAFMSYQNSDWKERLRKKMFRDGGWQQILIGILHSVQDVPWWTEDSEAALRYLANKDRPVTLASAAAGYYAIPFELRVKIVSILVQLLHGAPEIRAYIERCAEETMRIRRDRLERQREIKTLADVVKALEVEIKAAKQSRLTDMAEPKEEETDKEAQETETPTKKGRRGKKAAADADKTPSKDKDEAAATPPKVGPANLAKLEKKLAQSTAKMEELYEANRESELELVRLDCQRMRMLGSDRFCNRYWWFEHNGMRKHEYKTANEDKHDDTNDDNDGGEGEGEGDRKGDRKSERSSRTADADESTNEDDDEQEHTTNYAMGRLWIQGPSEGDFRMFLDLPGDYAVSPTPLERKKLSEGQGFLQGPQDWAYYDEPAEIEELIAFLDTRGKREFKLLAELKTLRGEIVASLEERHKDTAASQAEREQELAAALEDAISDGENADGSVDADDTETGDEILPNRRRSGRASRIADDSDEPGPKRKADSRRRGRPARRAALKTRSEATAEVLDRPTPRVRWWTNDLAVQELGHTLYDSYRKRGPRRRI